MNFKRLFNDNIYYELYGVEYKKTEINNNASNVVIEDTIKVHRKDEKLIVFLITRNAYFCPDSYFVANVSYLVTKECKKNIEISKDEIETLLTSISEEEAGELFFNVFSRLSCVLSQITFCDNFLPLITAPIPYLKLEDKNNN